MSNADQMALRFNEEDTFADTPDGNATGLSLTMVQAAKSYAAASGLDVFKPNQTVLISGCTNAASNGYKTVVSAVAALLVVKEVIGANEGPTAACTIKTAFNDIRFVSESLGMDTDTERSNEITDDRQIRDTVRTDINAAGDVNFEFSYDAFDQFLVAALLAADWSTEVTDTQITFAAGTETNKYTDSGNGFESAGFTANQWIEVRGFTTAANNGFRKIVSVDEPVGAYSAATTDAVAADNSYNDTVVDFVDTSAFVAGQKILVSGFTEGANNGIKTIVSVTNNKIIVSETLVNEALGDSVTIASVGTMVVAGVSLVAEVEGDSVTIVMGSQITNGVTEHSFSIEKEHTDIANEFVLLPGMEIDAMNLELAAKSKITGSFGFMGQKEESATASTGDGAEQDPPTNEIMSAVEDVVNIFENMSAQETTRFTLGLINNVRPRAIIGNLGPISMGQGKCDPTGSVELFFESKALMDKYRNYTESSLAFVLEDGDGNAYIVDMPKINYTDGKQVAGGENTDIIASMQYAAKKHPTEGITIRIAKFSA